MNLSHQRYARAGRNVAFGALERSVSTVAAIARVPLLLHWLGVGEYGLWLATAGIVATAHLIKFGVQYAIVSVVGDALGREDVATVRKAVTTAFLLYAAVATALIVLVVACTPFLPIGWILGVPATVAERARIAFVISAAGILLAMPPQVFAAALVGYQEEYAVSRWKSGATVVQLAGVVLVLAIGSRGDVIFAALYFAGTELLSNSLLALWIASRNKRDLWPSLRDWSPPLIRTLLGIGSFFVVADVANFLKYSLGSVLISHFSGPVAVVPFAVTLSLYMTGLGLCTLVASSFWPAYAEAAARGEWQWIQLAFFRSTTIATALGGLFACVSVVIGADVVRVWTQSRVATNTTLLAALGAWMVLQLWLAPSAALLNGLAKNRGLALSMLAEGFLGMALGALLAAPLGGLGVALGMVLAAIAAGGGIRPFLLTRVTEHRVHYPTLLLARVVTAGAVACGLGLFLETSLSSWPLVARAALSGLIVALSYGLLAWRLALPAASRRDLLAAGRALWIRFQGNVELSTK